VSYWSLIYTLRALFRLLTNFRVKGRERVPLQGPLILLSNHISHMDPPAHSAACPRAIDWVGSEILFRKPIWRWYFGTLNVIRVRQYEADQRALREAIRRVRSGRCVGLYPEGGIRAGESSILGSNRKLYRGGFMIATLTKAPILPCLVIGSDRLYNPASLLKRPPIWVRYGEPITVQGEGHDEIDRLEKLFVERVNQLAAELRAEGIIREDDWPQTPQQRNPRLPGAPQRLSG
jgi:1-acyl-sn-glycerol-3-phosphate acyltransferase